MNREYAKIFNSEAIKLFYSLNITKGDNTSSVLDMCSVFNGLNLFYIGSSGKTRKELDDLCSNLKQIFKNLPEFNYSYRSALTIPNNCFYDIDYGNTFSINNVLTKTPRSAAEINNLKKLVDEKFPNWYKDANNQIECLLFSNLNLIYESIFKTIWRNKFDKEYVIKSFYSKNEDGTTTIVRSPMMIRTQNTILQSYSCAKTNSLYVDIPFCNKYSMLIIRPNEILSKDQILNFCKNYLLLGDSRIIDFYEKYGKSTTFNEIYIPKFTLYSIYNLNSGFFNEDEDGNYDDIDDDDDDDTWMTPKFYNPILFQYCPYLNTIFNKMSNFSHISKDLKSHSDTNFTITSKLMCSNENEYENNDCTSSSSSSNDTFYKTNKDNILNIDRNCIFAIMHNKMLINSFGIFMGNRY